MTTSVGQDVLVLYGCSMTPGLRPLDLLEIEPCDLDAVRPGDVVALRSPDDGRIVIHRAARTRGPGGLGTAADATGVLDPWRLAETDFLGRVVACRRGVTRRVVRGGRIGTIEARLRRVLARGVRRALGLAARVRGSGHLRSRIPRLIRPRAVAVEIRGLRHVRLLVGRRVVASVAEGRVRWVTRSPLRRLVDVDRFTKLRRDPPTDRPARTRSPSRRDATRARTPAGPLP